MASLSNNVRNTLLRALSLRATHAENSDPAGTFPVPEHLRALEAEVVLIVGDRGAGKTQLKNALTRTDVREALARHAPGVRIPKGAVQWLQGWPLGTGGPDSRGWSELLRQTQKGDDLVAIWSAYLLRAVKPYLLDTEIQETAPIHEARAVDARAVLAAYNQVGVTVTAALDALDERMLREDRWLFVAYDELDTVVLEDWRALGAAIRGLVSFWAAYARRWKRLRPKLFLRSDFFKHHRDVAGADVAKLAGNRVELQWSDRNIYGALLKHILNKKDESGELRLRDHFKNTVNTTEDSVLGVLPSLGKAADAKPFIDRLISEYMGANEGKGQSFRWILDHLRDGNKHIVPRSLVLLVEKSAENELDRPRATGAHLLHHVAVRNALDNVSVEYVNQAKTHELRWLDGLANRLSSDRKVPWTRRELIKLLGRDFGETWGGMGARPPGEDAEEVLESLVELGVLRQRPGDSFDVPDLYLEGLGLKRKGGVARK